MSERTCAVDDCEKAARKDYKDAMCGMHRERLRLHGTTENQRPPLMRWQATNGYWHIKLPEHPLAMPSQRGAVQEHRVVLYEAIGPGEHPCHWCGAAVSWETAFPDGLVVDHLDGDRLNNERGNLVPSCMVCNCQRPARTRTHCGRGHELNELNTYVHRSGGVTRRTCRACRRLTLAARA